MAGKDFTGRGIDAIDDLLLMIDNLQRRVKLLENNTRPTVPGYNFTANPEDEAGDVPINPVEGQIAVGRDDNSLQYYVNGEWRQPSAVAGALPRARIWSTYATDVFTLSPGDGHLYWFNHGISLDSAYFGIANHGGIGSGGSDHLRIQIKQRGIYGITYRLMFDDTSGGGLTKYDDTAVEVALYDIAPDQFDGFFSRNQQEGYLGTAKTYITVVQEENTPVYVYATVANPVSATKTITFGSSSLHTGAPDDCTGNYIEVYRLSDTDTSDWEQWWFETPADEAIWDGS